jgi:two-component system, NarL family, nitrate/nitrite response regulator NarL
VAGRPGERDPERGDAIRVFVISGIRLYCDGLREILGRRERIEIAGMASGVEAACEHLRSTDSTVDVVLIDVAEPIGFDGLREVIGAVSKSRILAITVADCEQDVIACAESGVAGFVTREASIDELVDALYAVTRGEVHCSPRVTAALLRRLSSLASATEPANALTAREREILELIDIGLSNKMIALRLHIELPTVKNHVHHIIEKLGVGNRAQAAARMRSRMPA